MRRSAARTAVERALAAGSARTGFRLAEYSIQSNHLHLLVEADDRLRLSRGLQGLLVGIARTLNRLWRRSGSLFADRYHARTLRTPKEVRSALLYVLQNARHHGVALAGIDPCSSGAWFEGWRTVARIVLDASRAPGPRQDLARPPPPRARPSVPARTWLLRLGWRRHGLLGIGETPGPSGRALRSAARRA